MGRHHPQFHQPKPRRQWTTRERRQHRASMMHRSKTWLRRMPWKSGRFGSGVTDAVRRTGPETGESDSPRKPKKSSNSPVDGHPSAAHQPTKYSSSSECRRPDSHSDYGRSSTGAPIGSSRCHPAGVPTSEAKDVLALLDYSIPFRFNFWGLVSRVTVHRFGRSLSSGRDRHCSGSNSKCCSRQPRGLRLYDCWRGGSAEPAGGQPCSVSRDNAHLRKTACCSEGLRSASYAGSLPVPAPANVRWSGLEHS